MAWIVFGNYIWIHIHGNKWKYVARDWLSSHYFYLSSSIF